MKLKDIDKRIMETTERLLKIWTFGIEDDIPIKFEDNFAYSLFSSDISRLLKIYYTIGKKHQKMINKQNMSKRYNKNKDKL